MTKVLVTGAFGLLGSSLVPYLRSCQYDVFSLSQRRREGVSADLTSWNAVTEVLNKVMPDVIVNLAACTNVDECERNPQKAYLLNGCIVEHLSKWIQQNGDRCYLVQISTDQIYDGKGPHKEESITLCNYYGFSKYLGESAALSIPSTVLRTNFFGASQCEYRTSISDWIIKSLQRGDPIKVFDDVRFSPLSLNSLVKLLEVVIRKRQPGVYNLGSKDSASKADFAFMLAEELNLPTHSMKRELSDVLQLDAYRPKDMSMDSSCFERVFDVGLPFLREEIKSMRNDHYEFK